MTSVASCGSWNRTNGLLVQSQASLPTATIPHRSRSAMLVPPHGSHQGCGGRSRTCGPVVQSHVFLPTETTPQSNNQEGRAGLEPTRWYLTGTCSAAELPTQISERPAGVEPARPPWQGDRLPLHHGRLAGSRIVKDHKSTGRDSNPRHRSTGAVSSPLDHQCVVFSGRSVNTSLKPRASSLKPLSSGTGGYRTHIIRFKRPVHYLVCHSPASIGAVGVEPTACVL